MGAILACSGQDPDPQFGSAELTESGSEPLAEIGLNWR
jgi:hypothetical protein